MAGAAGGGRQSARAADPWAEFPIVQPASAGGGGDAMPASAEASGEWDAFPMADAPPPPAARPQRSFAGQMAHRLGVGARDVVEGAGASIPGMVYDAAAAPISLARLALGLSPLRSASELATAGADALALPKPENATERVQSRIQREVVGAGTGMGAGVAARGVAAAPTAVREAGRVLADMPGTQVAGAVAAGAAGAAAREAGAGDAGDLAASLPAGVIGAVGAGAAGRALAGTRALVAPLGESGRRRVVGSAMLATARDPENLAARLADDGERIPGVRPTTAEVSGDEGMFALERSLRSTPEGGPEFAAMDAARDQARRRAIAAVEPTEPPGTFGDTPDDLANATGRAPEAVAGVRDVVERRFNRLIDQGQQADQAIVGARRALPEREAPEVSGSAIRAPLREGDEASRSQVNRLYDDIDPQGESRLPMDWVRSAADSVEGRYWGDMSGGMPRDLRAAIEQIRSAPDVLPWRTMQNLRAWLGRQTDDADPRVQASVAEIRKAIDDTAEAAAQPRQPAGAARGLDDLDAAEAAEGLARRSDVREVVEREAASRAAEANRRGAQGLSLVQFLRRDPPRMPGQARGSFGGIRDPDGHLRAVLDGPRTMPGLIDQRGRSYEEAMQAAIDAGYFPGRSLQHDAGNPGASLTLSEFMEAIGDEVAGRGKRFPEATRAAREDAAEAARLRRDVERDLDSMGVSASDDPVTVGRALRDVDDEAAPAPMERADGTRTIPEDQRFTPDQAERWRAATEARTERGRTFGSGPVGDVLASRLGQPVVPDSGVAQRFFRAGSGAPEAADQFIRAAGGRPAAVAALEAHATRSMEDYARVPDGTLSAERMRRWMNHHGEALKRFPDLRKRLVKWMDAAARREAVEADKKAWTRETESGALRAFLHMEPEEAISRALLSANAEENVATLRGLLGNHPGALRALKRAYLDLWMDRSAGPPDALMRDRISPAASRRWIRNTERAGAALFGQQQWGRIQQIERDIESGTRVASVGRAIGSNTMQNASTAYFLSQLTGGLAVPEGLFTRAVGATAGKLVGMVLAAPQDQVRRLMIEAAADPALARQLVLEATPKRAADAARAMSRLMDPQRFRTAALEAGVREAARAGVSARVGAQDQPQREAVP